MIYESDYEEMEMPTPCQHCGRIFDLNDGTASEKWYPKTIICEKCGTIEAAEITKDEEIQNSKNELDDAIFTVNEQRELLRELGVNTELLLDFGKLKLKQ